MKAERQRRLSAKVARLMLAREMWAHAYRTYDYSVWDEDALLTQVYEKYIEKADKTIRGAMKLEEGA